MMRPPPPPPPPPPPSGAPNVEVMELTAASAAAQRQHQHMLLDLQAQRMASSMDVPTLPDQVRAALRQLNCPVRLFGENLAEVRDRLRLELAKRKVYGEHYAPGSAAPDVPSSTVSSSQQQQEETKYTRAETALVKAREKIAINSLQRAKDRLLREQKIRASYKALQMHKKRKAALVVDEEKEEEEEVKNKEEDDVGARGQQQSQQQAGAAYEIAERMDQDCCQFYKSVQQASLAGSQYGDVRALSAIATTSASSNTRGGGGSGHGVLTASWSATLQWWDGSTPTLDLQGKQQQAHEDRIMGVAIRNNNSTTAGNAVCMVGTASIDLTGKLWTLKESDTQMTDAAVVDDDENEKQEKEQESTSLQYEFEEVAHLKGHAARLCKIAFHPLGDWVVTTSHDHTWRLWDIETSSSAGGGGEGEELLLQDGHADKVFGVDFHPDGSLCSITDYSGMIHLWDLRTGKTALHYYGHAGRVLCAKFAPTNGFQLTTAGDDGCLKVWDLRHRRKASKGSGTHEPRRTIPAHSKLIPQIEYTQDDELLVSCSFDGTSKLWSTRGDWKLLQTLEGHEGKVMGVGIVANYYNDDNNNNNNNNNTAVVDEVLGGTGGTTKCRNWGIVTCGYDKTLKLWN